MKSYAVVNRRNLLAEKNLFHIFNDISTFVGYLIPKTSLLQNSSGTIQPIAGGWIWGGHTFPKSISPKVYAIVIISKEDSKLSPKKDSKFIRKK